MAPRRHRPAEQWVHLGIVVALLLALTGAAWVVDNALLRAAHEQVRRLTSESLGIHRAQLEDHLQRNLHHLGALEAFVKSRLVISKHIDEAEFRVFAKILAEGHPEIRSLQLAPNAVVTFIYPTEDNRAALGHRLLQDPKTRIAANRAIDTGTMVVAGPYELIQGGIALVARLPIFIANDDSEVQFWGFATELVDFYQLLQQAGLIEPRSAIHLAIRGRDALGKRGETFYGDAGVFQRDPVTMEVALPEGSWEIGAAPADGWGRDWTGRPYYIGATAVVILAVAMLVWMNLEKSAQLRASEQRFRRLATLDGLTGLANRREFDQTLIREWKRCARAGLPISLIMFDIDHFKPYNDRYGHLAGDDCIKAVAYEAMKIGQRPVDLVARYGGEEFAVLLPETRLEAARALAEKTREQVARLHSFNETLIGATITVSAGAACLRPHPNSEPVTLIERADRALYAAKAAGRNRVETDSGGDAA